MMGQSVWETATVDDDVRSIANGERLDFRAGPYHENEGDGRLPPAWDVDVESNVVGYEPVGATSIGTESERRRHTRFSYLRVPADRLSKLNEGRHHSDGTLGARLARLDKKRITQAYCAELNVTSFQRDLSARAMLLLNLDDFGHHKRIEKIALTVIRIMVNYNRFSHLGDEYADRISETGDFKELAESVGLDKRTMTRLSTRIKEELKSVEFFDKDRERVDLRRAQFRNQERRQPESLGQKWPL